MFCLLADATEKDYSSLTTASSINQLDSCAEDNVIIQCGDDGPSDNNADNYSISSNHHLIGRRCRHLTTTTKTTSSSNDYHHLHTVASNDLKFNVTDLISPPAIGIGDGLQGNAWHFFVFMHCRL